MFKFGGRCAAIVALGFIAACSSQEVTSTNLETSQAGPFNSPAYALVSTAGTVAQMRTKLPSSLCWDAGGSTRISLRNCDAAAGYQKFTIQSNGEIRLGYGCLVAWGDAGNDGDALTAYGCGSKSSIWTFTGAEEIRSFNNKCLQPQSVGNQGESIVLMPCTGALNQKWSNAAGSTAAPTPIASVTLSASSNSIEAGSQLQINSLIMDATSNALTDRTLVWSSSDNAIATISSSGLVTAVAAGPVVITVTVESKIASLALSVTPAPTSAGNGALEPGVTALMKTALPSGLCWDAGGSTRVSLRTCLPGAGYQQVVLNGNAELRIGNSCVVPWGGNGANGDPLTAYGCGGPTAKWTFTSVQEIRSFNNKCLQTEGSGNAGEQIVLAPCSGALNQKWTNSSASTPPVIPPAPPAPPTVPVPAAVASVSVALSPSSLLVGATSTASLSVKDSAGNSLTDRAVTWTTSNAAVATVSQTGTVTAISAGNAVISATSEGKAGTASVTVTTPPPPATGGGSLATGTAALMKTALSTGLCWDASSSTRVTLRTCAPGAGYQLFSLLSNGEMRLGSSCLIPWGGSGADGDPLTVYICGGASAKWTFTSASEIRSFNNKCLQVESVGGAGEQIVLRPCTGGTNQKWTNTGGTPSGTNPPVPAPVAVASVSVSLATTSLVSGSQTQATAIVRDASNNVLTDRPVTWTSSNNIVASVNSSGAVYATSQGSVSIVASVEGKSASAVLTVTSISGGPKSGYFVAVNGSSAGDGSVNQPWDIRTALAHPSRLQAGDTIWIRGGTYKGQYTSYINGQSGRPIIMRQYPGERATIDGGLAIRGANSWFWGFEVMNSDLSALVTAIDVFGAGTKVINMIVHDAAGNGIGLWEGANDAELNGNVIYNVGRAGSSAGRYAHGIYFQNVSAGKRLIDNVVLNSYSYNFHGYTENAGLNNLYLEGNISFNAGSYVSYGGAEYLIGGGQPVRNMTFTGNYSYRGGGMNARNEFGYGAPTPAGNSVTNNYLFGSTKVSYFDGGTFTGNTFANRPGSYQLVEFYQNSNQSLGSGFNFNNNTYRAPNANNVAAFRRVSGTGTGYSFAEWRGFGFDSNSDFQIAPITGTKAVVRANRYEAGHANIVVYNWDGLGSVSVDLRGVLSPGDRYEIREVQDYYGAVAAGGVFQGGDVSLSMAAVNAVRPLGPMNYAALSTGTEFHTFVVVKK